MATDLKKGFKFTGSTIAPPTKLYTALQARSAQSCTHLYTPSPRSLAPCLKLSGRRYICYAFMQVIGMVNDHTMNCFCYKNPIYGVIKTKPDLNNFQYNGTAN